MENMILEYEEIRNELLALKEMTVKSKDIVNAAQKIRTDIINLKVSEEWPPNINNLAHHDIVSGTLLETFLVTLLSGKTFSKKS